MIEVGATIDEPSVFLNAGRVTVLLWCGSIRNWRIGFVDNTVNQNPHLQFYLGPLSLVVWR